jgi:hypothetical protein
VGNPVFGHPALSVLVPFTQSAAREAAFAIHVAASADSEFKNERTLSLRKHTRSNFGIGPPGVGAQAREELLELTSEICVKARLLSSTDVRNPESGKAQYLLFSLNLIPVVAVLNSDRTLPRSLFASLRVPLPWPFPHHGLFCELCSSPN